MSEAFIGKYVIVRASQSGCWAGTLKSINGSTVELTDARRLWRWWAAEGVSLSGVAAVGLHPEKGKECRIACVVSVVMVMEVCEILLATDVARNSITSHEVRAA